MSDVTVLVENGTMSTSRQEAIAELCGDLGSCGVEVGIEQDTATPRAVTWYELTMIYLGGKMLDGVTGGLVESAFTTVRDRVVAWARRRQERDPKSLPQVVELYGPDGALLKTVRVERGRIAED